MKNKVLFICVLLFLLVAVFCVSSSAYDIVEVPTYNLFSSSEYSYSVGNYVNLPDNVTSSTLAWVRFPIDGVFRLWDVSLVSAGFNSTVFGLSCNPSTAYTVDLHFRNATVDKIYRFEANSSYSAVYVMVYWFMGSGASALDPNVSFNVVFERSIGGVISYERMSVASNTLPFYTSNGKPLNQLYQSNLLGGDLFPIHVLTGFSCPTDTEQDYFSYFAPFVFSSAYDNGLTDGAGTGGSYQDGYDAGYQAGLIDGADPDGLYQNGYDAGYAAGLIDGADPDGSYQDGYDAGYAAGLAEGAGTAGSYLQGYEDGYEDGHDAGVSEGYRTGYMAGESAGYNTGYSAGERAGYDIGYSEGEDAGYADGFTDGEVQGSPVSVSPDGFFNGVFNAAIAPFAALIIPFQRSGLLMPLIVVLSAVILVFLVVKLIKIFKG